VDSFSAAWRLDLNACLVNRANPAMRPGLAAVDQVQRTGGCQIPC